MQTGTQHLALLAIRGSSREWGFSSLAYTVTKTIPHGFAHAFAKIASSTESKPPYPSKRDDLIPIAFDIQDLF